MPREDFTVIKVCGTGTKRILCDFLTEGLAKAGYPVVRVKSPVDSKSPEGKLNRAVGGGKPGADAISEKCVVVLEQSLNNNDLLSDMSVFVTDRPLEKLNPRISAACNGVDYVLLRWGPDFAGESEIGIERKIKESTGAKKVLIFHNDESRTRDYLKMLDVAFSRIGGEIMPEDVPQEVLDAVKAKAKDGKMGCAAAHKLARDLGVPIPVVGRALDLLGIKIEKCQLGCF